MIIVEDNVLFSVFYILKGVSMNEDNFILDRLEFIVTNNCNLSCEYCYANSGSYNQKRMIISDDVIDKTYLFLK